MATILITGAAGFIGHNVVKILEQEHTIVGIDNFTSYTKSAPGRELSFLFNERRKRISSNILTVDIRDRSQLSKLFNLLPIDIVIHLASFPRQKTVEANPVEAADVMIGGLVNVLDLAATAGVKRFVYISSSMVYGNFTNGVAEYDQCSPIGQYGILKYAGEKLVEDTAKNYPIETVIVRPSAVYGELDVSDRVVGKFLLNALKGQQLTVHGATEMLDFTHVTDTAAGIALAATVPAAAGQIYNITRSSSTLFSLEDAAKLAVNIAGKGTLVTTTRNASFPSRGRLSINKAMLELGYCPKVDISEGFKRYYDWLMSTEIF